MNAGHLGWIEHRQRDNRPLGIGVGQGCIIRIQLEIVKRPRIPCDRIVGNMDESSGGGKPIATRFDVGLLAVQQR